MDKFKAKKVTKNDISLKEDLDYLKARKCPMCKEIRTFSTEAECLSHLEKEHHIAGQFSTAPFLSSISSSNRIVLGCVLKSAKEDNFQFAIPSNPAPRKTSHKSSKPQESYVAKNNSSFSSSSSSSSSASSSASSSTPSSSSSLSIISTTLANTDSPNDHNNSHNSYKGNYRNQNRNRHQTRKFQNRNRNRR